MATLDLRTPVWIEQMTARRQREAARHGAWAYHLPRLLKGTDGSGEAGALVIMNLVSRPGLTNYALYLYGQNGLLDFVCH